MRSLRPNSPPVNGGKDSQEPLPGPIAGKRRFVFTLNGVKATVGFGDWREKTWSSAWGGMEWVFSPRSPEVFVVLGNLV